MQIVDGREQFVFGTSHGVEQQKDPALPPAVAGHASSGFTSVGVCVPLQVNAMDPVAQSDAAPVPPHVPLASSNDAQRQTSADGSNETQQ